MPFLEKPGGTRDARAHAGSLPQASTRSNCYGTRGAEQQAGCQCLDFSGGLLDQLVRRVHGPELKPVVRALVASAGEAEEIYFGFLPKKSAGFVTSPGCLSLGFPKK